MYPAPLMQQGISEQDERYFSPRYLSTWLLLGIMRLAAAMPLKLLVAFGSIGGEILYLLAYERRRVVIVQRSVLFLLLGE